MPVDACPAIFKWVVPLLKRGVSLSYSLSWGKCVFFSVFFSLPYVLRCLGVCFEFFRLMWIPFLWSACGFYLLHHLLVSWDTHACLLLSKVKEKSCFIPLLSHGNRELIWPDFSVFLSLISLRFQSISTVTSVSPCVSDLIWAVSLYWQTPLSVCVFARESALIIALFMGLERFCLHLFFVHKAWLFFKVPL